MLVVVDAGCILDGYCSDCTRTFAVGEISERLQELYALCLEAQLAGLAAVAPGVHGRDADAASRTLIEAQGLGWAYGHGMGHGVGLQIHEAPTLRPESTDVLEAGNVVSVEPGIYIPDESAGVRIEDLVLVTEDGRERLTQFTKELITVAWGETTSPYMPLPWPRPSTRTSSATGCTSRSTAPSGASSSSSTSSPARAARSCGRSSRRSRRAPSSTGRSARARSSRACTPR